MKFIVSSSAILKQLSAIEGAVPSNPIVPILENFLFELKDGRLRVTASDYQITVSVEMMVETQEDGSVAVPAKMLTETLKNLPEQPVTFVLDADSFSIEIVSNTGRYRLAGENPEDFPVRNDLEDGQKLELTGEVLSSAIAYTNFAIGNDEIRQEINGLLLETVNNAISFVSTDKQRLVLYKRYDVSSETENSLIIPKKTLAILKRSLSEHLPVNVTFSESHIKFEIENICIHSVLIEGNFPDYQNVIPSESTNSNVMRIHRETFIKALKRIGIYANKSTSLVQLKLSSTDGLTLSAEDTDFANEAHELLACEYEGDTMDIGFNYRFLLDALTNTHSDEVTFRLSEPNRAGLMIPSNRSGNEDVVMLIMPIMLHSYYH